MAGRDTNDDEANKTERTILLVETITVGLGGYFIFGDQTSTVAECVAIFVIVINFMTVLLALRVLDQMMRRRKAIAPGPRTPSTLIWNSTWLAARKVLSLIEFKQYFASIKVRTR